MNKTLKFLTPLLTITLFLTHSIFSQTLLKPGFNSEEYNNLLRINAAAQLDSNFLIKNRIPFPIGSFHYRSKLTGLENRWEFWTDKRGVGIICIRGTVPKMNSWIENFYAAMISANGEIEFNNKIFKYKLSEDSNAYIHAGWLLGLASMADDIVSKIKLYHKKGINDFIITGHSQGGALAILLRAYLYYLDTPLDYNIHFKTYASATPKVGNLNFSYNFDYITRGGWAFRVINPLDWVPQIPFSIQKIKDVSEPNPFIMLNNNIDLQNIPTMDRIYLKHVYKKLNRKTIKSQEYYTKILGTKVSDFVKKSIPDYKNVEFINSLDYVDCGIPIILYPTNNYNKVYIKSREGTKDGVFLHHRIIAYLYLLKQNYPERD